MRRCRRRIVAIAGVVLALSGLSGGAARAGAWIQEPRHGFFKFSWRIIRADRFADPGGFQTGIPTVGDYTSAFYGEYGLNGRLTAIAYAPYLERITLNRIVSQPGGQQVTPGDSNTAIGDWDLGVRIGLRTGKPTVVSAGVVLGVPLGDSRQPSGLLTGDGELNQLVTLQVGHSFYPAPVYVGGEVGFNNRTRGFSDEYRYAAEVGITFGRRFTVILRARGVEPLRNGDSSVGGPIGLFSNDQRYLLYGPEFIYAFRESFGVTAGIEGARREQNILAATAYTVGFFFKQ